MRRVELLELYLTNTKEHTRPCNARNAVKQRTLIAQSIKSYASTGGEDLPLNQTRSARSTCVCDSPRTTSRQEFKRLGCELYLHETYIIQVRINHEIIKYKIIAV